MSDVYMYDYRLDEYCTQEYDFCKVGMVQDAPWYFPFMWEGADFPVDDLNPKPVQISPEFHPSQLDPFYEQLRICDYR